VKLFEIRELRKWLNSVDMANIFHVNFEKKRLDSNTLTFNINRTIQFKNMDKVPPSYFEKYEVSRNDTWMLISYNKYNTTRLWWLLCKINGVENPLDDPEPGTEIKIFNTETVNEIVRGLSE
jgi:hypothetical protein